MLKRGMNKTVELAHNINAIFRGLTSFNWGILRVTASNECPVKMVSEDLFAIGSTDFFQTKM